MDKVDSTQEPMGNVSREMEILRKDQKQKTKKLATKKHCNRNNDFDGLISRPSMAEQRRVEFSAGA